VTRAAIVDPDGPAASAAAGSGATPASSPVRNEDTNETKNGSPTSSYAVPAVVTNSR
jgi:hypothetical protein